MAEFGYQLEEVTVEAARIFQALVNQGIIRSNPGRRYNSRIKL